jgi:hypothetical protein
VIAIDAEVELVDGPTRGCIVFNLDRNVYVFLQEEQLNRVLSVVPSSLLAGLRYWYPGMQN